MFEEDFDTADGVLFAGGDDYDGWDSTPASEQENLPDGDGYGR
ncbi:MAG: hypothetical protein WDN76_04740 [Alphaproteobacteria bacterium]